MAEGISENRACIVNCLGDEKRHLVAELLTELTGRPVDVSECVSGSNVSWAIDNKYYTASVAFTVQSNSDKQFTERQWEAVLFLADLNQSNVEDVISKTWELFPSDERPSIVLLVGTLKEVEGSSCYQSQVLTWCVKHNVELVEWDQRREEDRDCEEDEEYPGITRVSEALQAHMWPSMELKTESHDRSRDLTGPHTETDEVKAKDAPEKSGTENTLESLLEKTESSTASQKDNSRKKIDSMLSEDEKLLAEGLDGDKDPGGESFEQLFSRFAQMKAHSTSLPHEERKVYAEKVVMAFWDAIGGDEEELKLDDSSQ